MCTVKLTKLSNFIILVLLMCLTSQVSAVPTRLPQSHYQDGEWQGKNDYTGNGLWVRIEFAVYDTEDHPADFTWDGELDMPAGDRYIYAYQIFNHPDSMDEVSTFSLMDTEGELVDESSMNSTCSQDDGYAESVEPTDSDRQGVWEFEFGTLIPGKASYFLIFSSEHAPQAGGYELVGTEDDDDLPAPIHSPEPSMVALLGLGSGVIVLQKRRHTSF